MKKRPGPDPIRWSDVSPTPVEVLGQTPGERVEPHQRQVVDEIAATTRLLGGEVLADELRLAQIRQRLLPLLGEAGARSPRLVRTRLRLAAVVVASLGMGGVAAAVTGRLIALRHASPDRAQGGQQQGAVSDAPTSRKGVRRWRVAVNAPATLDVSIGPDGTDVAMVEGSARISSADGARAALLEPGASWRSSSAQDESKVEATGVLRGGTAGDIEAPESNPPAAPAPPPRTSAVTHAPETPKSPARPAHARPQMSPPAVAAATRPRWAEPPRGETAESARGLAEIHVPTPAPTPGTTPGFTPTTPAASTELPRIELREPSPFLGGTTAPPGARPSVPSVLSSSAPRQPTEAVLVARALRHLRADGDATRALAQLDERDRRFPQGTFARESSLARAEALLSLERKSAALAVLDGLNLDGALVDRHAGLARADLRAASGRRVEALADYDAVLKNHHDDDIAARALFARALLRARAADAVGARDDLRAYLRRFSSGARRAEAESMLRRLGD